jgi:hypothetical protein
VGIDLLPERIAQAAGRLPAAVSLVVGDGLSDSEESGHAGPRSSKLPGALGAYDLVLLFTVLSSVLNADVRRQLIGQTWQRVAPGGALLVYDFVVDNPRNPGVRRVLMQELKSVCASAREARIVRLTLAPPLARAACQLHPGLYAWLNALPWLRTHRMACFVK